MDDAYPLPEDVDFSRESVAKLYESGAARGINPERWERIRKEVRFDDLVYDLTGKRGSLISCPFHGRDSTPSFGMYPGSNDGYCFGCPPGEQFYDHIRFVSKLLEINRVRALTWIEKKYQLEALPDILTEDEADEIISTITFKDLSEPFIRLAIKDIQTAKSASVAREYLQIYFKAESVAGDKNSTEEETAQATITLAEVLGAAELKRIRFQKAHA